MDRAPGPQPQVVAGWTFQPIELYAGGTLPTLTIKREHYTFRFLPCNPAKQAQYPDFVGYLINTLTGQKFGINATVVPGRPTRYTMAKCPVSLARDLPVLLPRLLAEVRAHGHRFPGDPR